MKSVLAAAALSALSSPAVAGGFYVGVEVGRTVARSNDVDESVVYTGTSTSPPVPASIKYDDVFGVEYKRGFDIDLIAGHDFGWFRLEGELSQKKVGLKRNISDDITDQFLGELNSALNRPSTAPDPGAPGLPALTILDFQPSGTLKMRAAMVNALLDLGVTDRFTLYGGGGGGRSFARGFNDHDGALAWQYMVGGRYALGRKIELGLKYRYFNSGIIKLDRDPIEYSGNPFRVPGDSSSMQTIDASVTPDIEGEFRTRSLLVSLIYDLR